MRRPYHARVFPAIALISVIGRTQTMTTSGLQTIQSVPRVSADAFDCQKHYYHTHPPIEEDPTVSFDEQDLFYETPVLVEKALSDKCELITDQLLQSADDLKVTVQRKTKHTSKVRGNKQQSTTKLYECSFNQAVDLMMQSTPDDCFFCFSEGLLNNGHDGQEKDMEEIVSILDSSKERLFNDCDLFQSFPDEIKPSDCVILAGEGATSTLHRDPFSWTGTSLCLEGSKVWRFIAPPGANCAIPESNGESGVSQIDETLKSYRLQSSAWDRGSSDEESGFVEVPLSAGWQSDFSLYETRSPGIPSARDWSDIGIDSRMKDMTSIALSAESLKPSAVLDENQDLVIWTVVQNPGDLLVIPAYWWHQTYALEPSLAIASQRCGLDRDAARVVHHVLETSGAEKSNHPLLKRESFKGKDPELIISALLDQLAVL